MSKLIAYHGDPRIKAKYLRRVRAHAKADEIIKGRYWEGGKGCAVGCTIHSGSHAAYETELGIPEALARLEDMLFEGQDNGAAKTFPARFLSAIKPGADVSRVQWVFLHWVLTEELTARDHPLVAAAVRQCAGVLVPLTKGQPVDRAAAAAAEAAAAAAAVETAEAIEAVRSARAAAVSSARATTWATRAAAWAAAAEAWGWPATEAEAEAEAVEAVAWAAYKRMADKLIELLEEAQ